MYRGQNAEAGLQDSLISHFLQQHRVLCAARDRDVEWLAVDCDALLLN